jgi:prepilin-type N-terminal cleavage/methylation domain-containing protein
MNSAMNSAMKYSGFTLIELAAVLAIMAILASMVMPSVAKLYARSEATTSINWMVTAVNYTRHAAISFRTTATLCPNHLTCGGQWHEDLMIFADRNGDGKFNQKDYLIHQINSQKVTGTFKWRSFRNRQYLQLTRFGYTNYQNGNFVYCPGRSSAKLARQIVINVQGRARVVHTRNDHGIPIDRKGKPLRC